MMNPIIYVLFALLPSAALSKEYYTAAVFEHRLRSDATDKSDPVEVITANLKFFQKAATIAAKHEADIIVFSEYGLVPYPENRENMKRFAENVPDPSKYKFNPCKEGTSDRFVLTSLSCLARDHSLYIVANMLDIQPCGSHCHVGSVKECDIKCSDDGVLIYNTNVVFDREGNLIARYHKMHPYFEVVNTPQEPEFITFDTEFGRFGLIVCFDSIFEESSKLVEEYGIDTLLFPTYWFDDIVSLNGVEWQQSWALANKVNFLAANAQSANTGSLGSGIYSKDFGALVYTYNNDDDSKLLLANVRIRGKNKIPLLSSTIIIREDSIFPEVEETGDSFPEQCFMDVAGSVKQHTDYRCFKHQVQNYTLSKLQTPSGHVESCNNGFCCKLKYSTEKLQEEWYLAAFNGTNNVENFYHWWEENCLLVRCDPFEGKECVMLPSTSKTVFRNLELSASFNAQKVYPTVSKNKYRLAPLFEWSYETQGLTTVLKFQSSSNLPLLKAALLGRNYKLDPTFEPYYKYSMPKNIIIPVSFNALLNK